MRGLIYRLQIRRLDRELASGFQPDHRAGRCRRGRELTEMGFRRRLARDLEQLVREAEGSPAWQSPVRWPAVRKQSILLLVLADSLAAPTDVSPQGVARAKLLFDDGAGPLYGPEAAGALEGAIRSALAGLELGPKIGRRRDDLDRDVDRPTSEPLRETWL